MRCSYIWKGEYQVFHYPLSKLYKHCRKMHRLTWHYFVLALNIYNIGDLDFNL